MADSVGSLGNIFQVGIDDIDTVLAIRAKALTLLSEGKTLMEWESEGSSGKREFVLPISQILRECTRFLRDADPATYGAPIYRSKTFRV